MTSQSTSEPRPVTCIKESVAIAVVTIDRKARRNALNLEVKNQIADLVAELAADESIRVIILTGANGVFVAGTDIAEMASMSPTDHILLATDRVFRVLRNCLTPLVAAVEGYAYGGGCELALSCDIIVAGEGARFGQPEVQVGIMPGAGGTQRLLRTIGKYRAMKMILTGEPVTAAEAFAMGMVSEVTPNGADSQPCPGDCPNYLRHAAPCCSRHQGGGRARPGRPAGDSAFAGAQSVPTTV